MGYPVKVQKVERPTNRSFYINLPAALADAVQLAKGESLEWFIEDKNTCEIFWREALSGRWQTPVNPNIVLGENSDDDVRRHYRPYHIKNT